jgi:hypothetical protein
MVTQSETHDRTNQAGDVFEAGCYPQIFYGKKLNGEETKHLDGNLIGISWDNIMYIYNIP